MDNADFLQTTEDYPLQPAEPEEMPEATIWPFGLAFGTLFLFWGFLTSLIISGVGLVLMGVAIAGWIEDLKYE